MADEPARWLGQAHLDFEAARYNLKGGHLAVAAFLAQQSAEKALKALFMHHHGRLWRTHDLVALAEQVEAPQPVLDACEWLSPHYIATRYPLGIDVEYNEESVEEALDAAEKILDWVEGSQ